MKKKTPAQKFKFRRNATIGAASAEEDKKFLDACFVDTGDIEVLADCSVPTRLILGRTGVGKSALIQKMVDDHGAILVNPESLSFNYLSNSNILQFFISAGVKLDLFFKLLWRHIFTVELIKSKYHIQNEKDQDSFLQKMSNWVFRDKKKEKAVNYLMEFGNKFWEETEYRIQEVTNLIEDKLEGAIKGKFEFAELSAAAATKLSQEQKVEIISRAQKVINEIHIKELTNILEFLNEDIFGKSGENYYLCIDRLDEDWIEDKFRYLLIRSLIETVRDFNKVRNVKIIVALRSDLLYRVFQETRDGGFQEEKYRSIFLNLKWNKPQLKEVLDKRINFLIKESFTASQVTAKNILSFKIDGKTPFDYLVERTLMRPRELIEFFNICIDQAEGNPKINKKIFMTAEGIYSKNRLRSLLDEWNSNYPTLVEFAILLKERNAQFKLSNIDQDFIQEFCINYEIKYPNAEDELSKAVKRVINNPNNIEEFLRLIFKVFYQISLVGLKTESYESYEWSYIGTPTMPGTAIDLNTSVYIHPTFWRALGINASQRTH